jgi:hypothetical protein
MTKTLLASAERAVFSRRHGLVAQKVDLRVVRDRFALPVGKFEEVVAFRLVFGFELFEALVAGDDVQVVLVLKQRGEFVGFFEFELCVIFQIGLPPL